MEMGKRLKETLTDLSWAIKLVVGDKLIIAFAILILMLLCWSAYNYPLQTFCVFGLLWFISSVFEKYLEIQEWKKDLK